MWSRGKGASRNFLPGFPLGQSMTYRLPLPANQAPGTAYTTTSQPSDGPLAVGLLAPGQSQQRLKKKKSHRRGIAHYKNRPCFVGRSFLLQLVSTTTTSTTICIAVLTWLWYSATLQTTLPIYPYYHQTTAYTMPSVDTSQFPPCPGPPPKGPLPPLPK